MGECMKMEFTFQLFIIRCKCNSSDVVTEYGTHNISRHVPEYITLPLIVALFSCQLEIM